MTTYVQADIYDVNSPMMARFIHDERHDKTYFAFVDERGKERKMVLSSAGIDAIRKFIGEIDKAPFVGLVDSIQILA